MPACGSFVKRPNNLGLWTEIPQQLQGKGFDKLFEMSKFAAMNEEDRMMYINRQKEIMDQRAAMHTTPHTRAARKAAQKV